MPSQTLLEASKKGIHLYLNGAELAFKAPAGAMTPQLREAIVRHKSAIIALLQSHEKSRLGMPQVTRAAPAADYPLSFAQQRLWLLNEIDGGSTHYNMPNAMRLSGRLDLAALQRAFDRIVERHAVLRTVFAATPDGEPRQVVRAARACPIALRDLTQLAGGEQQLQLAQAVADESSLPFDLKQDLMLRVSLLKLAQDEHVLLVTMHHIASDGWSTGVLIAEFCALYQAIVAGRPDPLPPLAVQYTDYAQWQRDWLQGEVFEREMGYWTGQLAGLPVVHSLPLDFARPPVQAFAGASHTTQLDAATRAALQALCQEAGTTLFTGLHAALAVLLARYSNETDIVVGIPTANREQAEIAGLIGFFVNTLVLRSDLSGAPDFRAMLGQGKRVLADAYAHQQVPFEQIVEQLQPERSLGHHPLFQVVLVLQNSDDSAPAVPGLSLSALEDNNRVAKYDLLVNVTRDGGGLALRWDYNVDLFAAATIERMAQQFGQLLKAMLAAPDENVFRLDMLSAAERQQQLVEWNPPAAAYPADQCIHAMFEAQAARTPQALALTCEGQSLTYAELNAQANRLAHLLLAERQVGPDTLVGICVERSPAMLVAILAVLKAGGAYVPLDPDYPAARVAYIQADAQLGTIVTTAGVRQALPQIAAQALCLDDAHTVQRLAAQPASNPAVPGLAPHHLAYVIYTSGSTGNPKGVLIEHQNVRRLFDAAAFGFDFGPSDVWTLFHSFAFDFSVWEIWGALLFGGRLVVVPHWVARSAEDFHRLVEREGVTVLNQTPGAFYQFIAADAARAAALALRYVVFGGEALNLAALQPWVERHGDAAPQLINMYGITETTVHVTYRRLLAADIAAAREASVIGRPLDDLGVLVLNPAGMPVPVGVAGEMHVRGAGLARGYLNQPELTAQRFIDNRYGPGRLYRSGDLVRWSAKGELEYIGRIDHQVKVRGFRIELGEVEAAILQLDGVAETIVLARGEPKRLVAYIVAPERDGDAAALAESLRAALRQVLPDYMVPSAFVVLAALPLTANGKIDRAALPAPDAVAQLAGQYVAPDSASERALCQIWQQVLGVARVGVHDNFFALGGDSILSIRVVALARQQGMDFSVKDLFAAQTVAALCARAPAAARAAAALAPPFGLLDDAERARLAGRALDDAYPLSALQQGMIFHHQMRQEHGTYHDIFSFRLAEPWDEAAFRAALASLMERNELLRSVVSFEGERPLHLIHAALPVPLQVHDLRGAAADAVLAGWLEQEKGAAFDWARPMWSAVIHRLTDDSFQYSLSFHHALMDGWSVATMNAELFQAYRQVRAGQAPAWQPRPPYRHFIAEELAGLADPAAQAYWRGALADAELPWWTGRPKQHSLHSGTWTLDDARGHALQALAKRLGVQEKAIFLAAHMVLMGLLNGKPAVTSSVVFNGRPEVLGSERTLGLFLNSLPFHVDGQAASWAALAVSVNQQLLDMTAYRQYPLGSIQRDTGLDFSASLFNYTNFNVYDEIKGELGLEAMDGFEDTNYLFSLSCSKNSRTNQYSLFMVVDSSLFDAAFTARIQGYLERILAAFASTPDAAIDRAQLIGADERARLMEAARGPARSLPPALCVHQMFEAHAAAMPDALAVRCGGLQYSYGELNRRANQLAHYLVAERGVGPDTLVGICALRSLDMMVAILGVLKAGAAYVPLDPDYPAARLSYMLADARLDTVLTQQQLLAQVPQIAPLALCLDRPELAARLAAAPSSNLDVPALGLTPAHLAYVIYTSGSTGNPKGVGVLHSGVVNYLSYIGAVYFPGVAGAVASSPLAFDATVTSLLGPLASGKWVDLVAQDGQEIEHLAQRMREARAPLLFKITPAHMESLAYRLDGGQASTLAHWLIIGGEQLTTKVAAQWKEQLLPGAVLVNEYGPTETVVGCSTLILSDAGGIDRSKAAVPIGRPIDNTQLYVVDAGLAPTPFGVPGELCIGGAGLAREYLGRAELTAEKFVDNPFRDGGSARLYRTGDLVRWLPDATLEFLGRIDHQVKIRGYRIELGEIESVLAAHAQVREALVLAHAAADGERRLVAYVVTAVAGDDARRALEGGLRAHLARSLPEFMVPAAIVLMDGMPLTANGKVDRKALPQPDLEQRRARYVAPRTATEERLCALWQGVLGVERVGVADNFFDLGGHSLLAMKLLAAVETAFAVKLGVKLVFQFPDVQGLAAYLDVLNPPTDSAPDGAAEDMEVFQL